MTERVAYDRQDRVATITMDDGKRNALSFETFAQLGAALDRAEADRAVVVLTGREGVFSAGFDLGTLRAGPPDAPRLVLAGFELAARIFAFPAPVVVACPGHAIAMGAFLALAADHRVGAQGPFKIGANEVAIGLVVPHFAVEICRQRLAPTHLQRAVTLSEMFSPEEAAAAGFLDRVVPAAELAATARATATQLAALDLDVHAATKRRLRARAREALQAALEADAADLGVRI
jgi:enoyl-CoA hydratase